MVLTAAQDAAPRGAAVDAEGYVAKPFDLDELVERVAAVLGGDGRSPEEEGLG